LRQIAAVTFDWMPCRAQRSRTCSSRAHASASRVAARCRSRADRIAVAVSTTRRGRPAPLYIADFSRRSARGAMSANFSSVAEAAVIATK
jgi:hypothetical protein